MLGNNLVRPSEGLLPRLELQREDQKLHSPCFQKQVVILDLPFFTKVQILSTSEMRVIQRILRETGRRKIGTKGAFAGVAILSVFWGITHVVVSRTQDVGNMIVDRLESAVGDLPLFIVLGLGDVPHMDRHGYVHLLLVLLDPFRLFEKTASLIPNARPVLLSFPMPDIGVTLGVRQNDQRKEIRISFGSLMRANRPLFCVNSKHVDLIVLTN